MAPEAREDIGWMGISFTVAEERLPAQRPPFTVIEGNHWRVWVLPFTGAFLLPVDVNGRVISPSLLVRSKWK